MKDLILLVADKNMQFALKGALDRPQSLGIRPLNFDFIVHPGRDGGVRSTGPAMLALEHSRFTHAALLLDHEGSGSAESADSLEIDLDRRVSPAWGANGKAIVISPELDIWMWGSDNAVEQTIEWTNPQGIREWLSNKQFRFDANNKPSRPKEALETALRQINMPRSSALYQKIASRISLPRCVDPAFQKFRNKLIEWFPQPPPLS
jgi:hypothetical protein